MVPGPLHADVPPSQTIYVNNLNEKIKKEELKKSLYAVFSQFGKILDIVALKTLKLRGQAWIVFSDITASSNALRQMQGFPFYDKPMRIQFAKTKSDAVAKGDGTFVPKDKRTKAEEKGRRKEPGLQPQLSPVPLPGFAAPQYAPQIPYPVPVLPPAPPQPEAPVPPNNLLFVSNLPLQTSPAMLSALFNQYPGFKEARMIESKPGIAFVEFSDEMQSTVAMGALNNFKLTPTNPMTVTFAKKG